MKTIKSLPVLSFPNSLEATMSPASYLPLRFPCIHTRCYLLINLGVTHWLSVTVGDWASSLASSATLYFLSFLPLGLVIVQVLIKSLFALLWLCKYCHCRAKYFTISCICCMLFYPELKIASLFFFFIRVSYRPIVNFFFFQILQQICDVTVDQFFHSTTFKHFISSMSPLPTEVFS